MHVVCEGWPEIVFVARKVPPPDFRYVWLTPGTSSAALALAGAAIGVGSFGLALLTSGRHPLSFGLMLAGGAVAVAAMIGPGERRPRADRGAREVAMAIVPWGVIVSPETEPRVLRWPAIRKVSVDVAHTMRGGTPSVVATVVTVHTESDHLAGRTGGAAGLEGLTVNLEGYAEEAARPVALDLDGEEPAGDGATEPVMIPLLRRAEELCATGSGAARLGLPPGGYRAIASRAAAPETLALLRDALASGAEGRVADPRPLAAIVAVLLGARDLVPDLLRLVSSPHPVVAAVAKAAAIRLGAAQSRAGAVDEVAAFLFEDDFEQIQRWADRA